MVRSMPAPGKGFAGCRVSQGPCMPQEGCCRGQGIMGTMGAPGRALQEIGCGRVHACPRKGVAGVRASQGPWTP